MKKVERFDELPRKIKFVVGGGTTEKHIEQARRHFGEFNVYECKSLKEMQEVMKRVELEPQLIIDRRADNTRYFLVGLGLPERKEVTDLILFNTIKNFDTVLYFTEVKKNQLQIIRKEEKSARNYFKYKLNKKQK